MVKLNIRCRWNFAERHLAARFAGKEAVAKAFGTGIGKARAGATSISGKRRAANRFWFFQDRPNVCRRSGVISALSLFTTQTIRSRLRCSGGIVALYQGCAYSTEWASVHLRCFQFQVRTGHRPLAYSVTLINGRSRENIETGRALRQVSC